MWRRVEISKCSIKHTPWSLGSSPTINSCMKHIFTAILVSYLKNVCEKCAVENAEFVTHNKDIPETFQPLSHSQGDRKVDSAWWRIDRLSVIWCRTQLKRSISDETHCRLLASQVHRCWFSPHIQDNDSSQIIWIFTHSQQSHHFWCLLNVHENNFWCISSKIKVCRTSNNG